MLVTFEKLNQITNSFLMEVGTLFQTMSLAGDGA